MAYGFPEKIQILCPFCGSPINVLWVPETKKRVKTTWGGSKAGFKKTRSEEYLVREDCPSCKKTKDEIQRALSEEQRERSVSVSHSFTKYSFRKGGKK